MKAFQETMTAIYIVNSPTRDDNTRDLILTNLDEFCDSPIKRPLFGLSDQVTIENNHLKDQKILGQKWR